MTYELDNEGFFEALRTRKRKVTTMTPETEPSVATTAGPIPSIAATDVHLRVQEGIAKAQEAARAKAKELRNLITGFVVLVGGGIGIGGPIGYFFHAASAVEKTVEKVIKVPVPAQPRPLPIFQAQCPRCGQMLLLKPPGTGQVGALPDPEDDHDQPVNEGPRRQGNDSRLRDPSRRVPVPAKPVGRPAFGPRSLAVAAGPA